MKQTYLSFARAGATEGHERHCILTPLTLAAIEALQIIDFDSFDTSPHPLPPTEVTTKLLTLLLAANLIRSSPQAKGQHPFLGYELTKPMHEISLLQLLKAINEHLDCNDEVNEDLYNRYWQVSHKLGIINHITRRYLSEIKLSDL